MIFIEIPAETLYNEYMTNMNVSLPNEMKEWIVSRTETGRYGNSSDYIRDLIRRDQQREAKRAHLQNLITEGLESGICEQSLDEICAEARAELEADHEIISA